MKNETKDYIYKIVKELVESEFKKYFPNVNPVPFLSDPCIIPSPPYQPLPYIPAPPYQPQPYIPYIPPYHVYSTNTKEASK